MGRLLRHLLERLAHRRQLGAASRQRVQHLAERATLFTRGRDELFEFVGVLLRRFSTGHVLQGFKHGRKHIQ